MVLAPTGQSIHDDEQSPAARMLEAVRSASLSEVQELYGGLESKEVLTAKNKDGASLVHFAVRRGEMEILKWLLVEGAPVQDTTNPTMEDSNLAGSTPLHWLAHADETTQVSLAQGGASKTHMAVELIDAGARVDPLDEFLRTPLLCASGAGDSSLMLLLL